MGNEAAFWSGLATGFGLIIAIGAQNAYVLKQGILRNHPFAIALTCSILDAVLIVLGVLGLGTLISSNFFLLYAARFGGAVFLIYYGCKSFVSVFSVHSIDLDSSKNKTDRKTTIMTVLALSLLNPHLYLDTCLLIGTIGSQFTDDLHRMYYALGAVIASFVWFFTLSYGAALLAPMFRNAVAWKVLDALIAVTMWTIAGFLIKGV